MKKVKEKIKFGRKRHERGESEEGDYESEKLSVHLSSWGDMPSFFRSERADAPSALIFTFNLVGFFDVFEWYIGVIL